MADELMYNYITNDEKQNYCRIQLVVKTFGQPIKSH